jgi:hypothetical protein
LLTEVHVLSYQTLCHNSFHLTIMFKFVAAKVFASALETDVNRSAPDRGCMRDVQRCFSYEIICHANLYIYVYIDIKADPIGHAV